MISTKPQNTHDNDKTMEPYAPKSPKSNALPLGDTIDIPMDIEDKEKVIKIGKFLNDEEQEDTTTLIHEFPKKIAWKYLDMLGIDLKIVIYNIVLANNAKPVRHKIQKNESEDHLAC